MSECICEGKRGTKRWSARTTKTMKRVARMVLEVSNCTVIIVMIIILMTIAITISSVRQTHVIYICVFYICNMQIHTKRMQKKMETFFFCFCTCARKKGFIERMHFLLLHTINNYKKFSCPEFVCCAILCFFILSFSNIRPYSAKSRRVRVQ